MRGSALGQRRGLLPKSVLTIAAALSALSWAFFRTQNPPQWRYRARAAVERQGVGPRLRRCLGVSSAAKPPKSSRVFHDHAAVGAPSPTSGTYSQYDDSI